MSSINFEKNSVILTKNNDNTLEKPEPKKKMLPHIIHKAFEEYNGMWHDPQHIYKNEKGWDKCKNDIVSEYFKDFEEWIGEKDFKHLETKKKVKSGCVKFYALHGLVSCFNDLQEEKIAVKYLTNQNEKLKTKLNKEFLGDTELIDENEKLKDEIKLLRKQKTKLKNQLYTEKEKVNRLLVSKKVVGPQIGAETQPIIKNKERYEEIMSITGNPTDDTSSEEISKETCEKIQNLEKRVNTEMKKIENLEKVLKPSEKDRKCMNIDGKIVWQTEDEIKLTKKIDEKPKKETSKPKKASKKTEKTLKKTKEKKLEKPTKYNEKNKICEVFIENKTFNSQVDLYITEDYAFYKDGSDKYHYVGKIELQKPPEYLRSFENVANYTDNRGFFVNVYNDEVVDFTINITEKGEKKLNELLQKDGDGIFSQYKKDKIYKCIEWEKHDLQVEHKFKGFTNNPEKEVYTLLVNMKEYNIENYRN